MRPFAPYQAVSLFFMLSSSALGLAGPLLMKWMIDDILPNRRWGALASATALFFGVYVGRSLLGSISGLVNMFGVQRHRLEHPHADPQAPAVAFSRVLRHASRLAISCSGSSSDVDMVSEAGSTIAAVRRPHGSSRS